MFNSENHTADNALSNAEQPKKVETDDLIGSEEEEEEECWGDAKEDYDIHTIDNHLQDLHVSKNDRTMSNNDNKSDKTKPVTTNTSTSSCSSAHSSTHSTNVNSKQTISSSVESSNLILHEAVFNNDVNKIYEILKQSDSVKDIINKKDKHGNTPMHLACMMGRSKEVVSALLQCGAALDTKNINRWNPFQEACSYGNREVISMLIKQLNNEVHEALNKHKLSESLEKTKNYRVTLKWEFQSWIPFLSRCLPSDVCVINKQGKYIRIDTKILDFETLWKRSDSCLVYSDKFAKRWVIMNNKTKKYQFLQSPENFYKNIEDKVDEFMSTDIVDFELKSADIQLVRRDNWLWKYLTDEKYEKIGKYNSILYTFENVFLVTRKRREHLTDEDVKRNKAHYKSIIHFMKSGKKVDVKDIEEPSTDGDEDAYNNVNHDASDKEEDWVPPDKLTYTAERRLSPPPTTDVTWEQYCLAEPPGTFPTIGREQKCKTTKTAFRASVNVSEDFPITKNEFLDLLSVIPLKLFRKLKEFIELKLPEGFPIRLDLPLLPFLSARITFEDFTFVDGPVDDSLFSIPDDYEFDPNMTNLLSGR